MDEKLMMFVTDTELHEKVIEHLIVKKTPINKVNVFYQPETWEFLGEYIGAGKYHFGPLKEDYIDKRNKAHMTFEQVEKRNAVDVRKLYMFDADTTDRAVIHMIYLIYYKLYIKYTSEFCVSYKSGIGISKVDKHLSEEMNKRKWFDGFKADISKYFDKVNIETIEQMLEFMNTKSPLDDLLYELYHDDRVIINGKQTHKYRGLIQGCAFACLLANLCLKDIDDEISKLNVIYYRYSDDIICLGPDWKKALKILRNMLKPKGLELHPDKLQYINKNKWFEFLGFKMKGEYIGPAKKTVKAFEHEIKMRTLAKSRQLHRPCTKTEIRRMIKSIQSYLFTAYAKDHERFGMGVYLFGTVNILQDIQSIDEYCKDCLRAAYTNESVIYGLGSVDDRKDYTIPFQTGKNVAENRRKTQKGDWDLVEECGWVSLVTMYNAYHTDIDLFDALVLRMANGL